MKEALHLTQEQKLQQRLSPQQVQFVRLLEMNSLEVEDEVRHEILDNPAIEVAEQDDSQKNGSEEGGEESEEKLTTLLPTRQWRATPTIRRTMPTTLPTIA